MKKLSLFSLFLLVYLFLFKKSNFEAVNVYTSLFFHLHVFLAVFLAAEVLQHLCKTKTGAERRKNVRVLLAAIFFSVLLLEMFLRFGLARYMNYMEANQGWYQSPYAIHNDSWYHLRSRSRSYSDHRGEFRFDYKCNREGLFDRDHARAKFPGEFRIVALGDSFTEGAGAEQHSSWPAQLEKNLNTGKNKGKFTLIKAGVSGSDPFFEYVLLRDRLLKYRPDLVIVAVNASDIDDVSMRGGMERFRSGGRIAFRKKRPSWEWLYSLSFITRLVVHDGLGLDWNLEKKSDLAKNTAAFKEQLHSCLRSFVALAGREGFQLLLVFHPMRFEIDTRQMVLADLAARLQAEPGIQVLDLHEFYVQKEGISRADSGRYYWQFDLHHNASGYAAFARGVAWKLRLMGIAP